MTVTFEATHEERRAMIAAETATWPDRYQTVRDAIALGFVPSAYGSQDPPPLLRPPTKFSYPPGGLEYPHHAGGAREGAMFGFWCFADESPDELRDRPVWLGVQPSGVVGPFRYRVPHGMTFDEAIAACLEAAGYYRKHFIVPDWDAGSPRLPVLAWREIAAMALEPPPSGQLALFAKPPTPLALAQQAIADLIHGMPDDALVPFPQRSYDVERLIDRANWERSQRNPEIDACGVMSA